MDTNLILYLVLFGIATAAWGYLRLQYERKLFEQQINQDDDPEDELIYVWLSDDAEDALPIGLKSNQALERKAMAEWN
jgi:hypothetical protein